MSNIYAWKTSELPYIKDAKHADPQRIGEALEQIGKLGEIKPQAIVDAARKDPVLHPHFEWDDGVAGELHRRSQARSLVSSLRVERIAANGQTVAAPAFISLPGLEKDSGLSYQPLDVVESSATLQRQMLTQALGDLRSWTHRYTILASVCNMLQPALAALESELKRFDSAAETASESITRRGRKKPAAEQPNAQ
jgi:hypothetical protein